MQHSDCLFVVGAVVIDIEDLGGNLAVDRRGEPHLDVLVGMAERGGFVMGDGTQQIPVHALDDLAEIGVLADLLGGRGFNILRGDFIELGDVERLLIAVNLGNEIACGACLDRTDRRGGAQRRALRFQLGDLVVKVLLIAREQLLAQNGGQKVLLHGIHVGIFAGVDRLHQRDHTLIDLAVEGVDTDVGRVVDLVERFEIRDALVELLTLLNLGDVLLRVVRGRDDAVGGDLAAVADFIDHYARRACIEILLIPDDQGF